jgi:hypothetical protein
MPIIDSFNIDEAIANGKPKTIPAQISHAEAIKILAEFFESQCTINDSTGKTIEMLSQRIDILSRRIDATNN